MAFLQFNIPEGAAWGDYFYESDTNSVRTLDYIDSESDGEWETVGHPKLTRAMAIVEEFKPPAKWCRDGNACQWKNCKFRHERCSHYDNWIRRGKRGHNCRCYTTDPESKKRPDEGGCMYDHRDMSKLQMFVETVSCSSESELWEQFYERGLDMRVVDIYDMRQMSRLDKALLIRSLRAHNIQHEEDDTCIHIYFE